MSVNMYNRYHRYCMCTPNFIFYMYEYLSEIPCSLLFAFFVSSQVHFVVHFANNADSPEPKLVFSIEDNNGKEDLEEQDQYGLNDQSRSEWKENFKQLWKTDRPPTFGRRRHKRIGIQSLFRIALLKARFYRFLLKSLARIRQRKADQLALANTGNTVGTTSLSRGDRSRPNTMRFGGLVRASFTNSFKLSPIVSKMPAMVPRPEEEMMGAPLNHQTTDSGSLSAGAGAGTSSPIAGAAIRRVRLTSIAYMKKARAASMIMPHYSADF